MSNTRADTQGKKPPPAIADALEKNKQVAEEIKDAADDLLIVHTVLDQQLPDGARQGDVEQAVAHTGELEKKLAKSAKKLDAVNEKLQREVERSTGQGA